MKEKILNVLQWRAWKCYDKGKIQWMEAVTDPLKAMKKVTNSCNRRLESLAMNFSGQSCAVRQEEMGREAFSN